MDYMVEDFASIAAGLKRLEDEKREMLERMPVDTPVEVKHSIINYDPLQGNWVYQRSS